MPTINFSKVQALVVSPVEGGTAVRITYKSGQKRGLTFGQDETGLGDLIVAARKAAVTIVGLAEQTSPPAATGTALAEILGLTSGQVRHLAGADRLNFWRNGSLYVQVQHGNQGIKLACPKAVITDAQLSVFFASWGWQQVNSKPYFRATANSLVRI